MAPKDIQIRVYEESDYEMIAGWHQAHKQRHRSVYHEIGRLPFLPKEAMPPIGQIAFREAKKGERDDLAAMFLYLAQAAPVGFVEHAVTKPGLPVATSIRALLLVLGCLQEVARTLGCVGMMVHTIPAIARYMQRLGWHQGETGLVRLWRLTNETL